MTVYGLEYQGQLLRYTTSSNGDAEFADSTCVEFDTTSESVFVTTDPVQADRYRVQGNHWYNGFVQPYSNVKVVAVELTF